MLLLDRIELECADRGRKHRGTSEAHRQRQRRYQLANERLDTRKHGQCACGAAPKRCHDFGDQCDDNLSPEEPDDQREHRKEELPEAIAVLGQNDPDLVDRRHLARERVTHRCDKQRRHTDDERNQGGERADRSKTVHQAGSHVVCYTIPTVWVRVPIFTTGRLALKCM